MEYQWKTAAIIREATDAVTIVFDSGQEPFTYLPGQFVNVGLRIDGQFVSRSYSLSTSPDEEWPAITVKKVEGGIMSTYIVDHAEEIKEWTVEGPHGLFFLSDEAKDFNHIVFIAGGSGITPIYAMLKYALMHTSAKVTLVYTSKAWAGKIFSTALLRITQAYPDRLQLHLTLSQADAEEASVSNCLSGRLTKLVLKKLLKKSAAPDAGLTHYFICGPNGLIALAEETLAALEVKGEHIHKEYFTTEGLAKDEVDLPDSTQEVLLHFYEQSNLLEVAPGQTILDAALTDKIELPYSCKNGTCGKCTGKLLSGQVHMSQNFVLNKEHVQEGYILLCQSHPLTSDVTVEAF
ncbi:MAG TPA: 2Fe-2S iron-sulfur cluster-binding protein [Flavisolibacter sp.]|nr:2Fe-2S iron-sulfur cluster-binding protein [Flavisolibacter sp.]